MSSQRTVAQDSTPSELAARERRLDALETRALAARCLAGIGQLAEVILGPRARHEERLLDALLARTPAERTESLRSELLESRRELALRCGALAQLEREQSASAARELELQRELEELRRQCAALEPRPEPSAEELAALELARNALAQIERELAALRAERDWRASEMRAVAPELGRLRFRLLAPELSLRARRWSQGTP